MILITVFTLGMVLPKHLVDCLPKDLYCNLSPKHTLCKYKTHTVGNECPADTKFTELSEREKSTMLRKHNEYRSDVARGDRIKFYCPNGADILHMEWDGELQRIAERWVMQCIGRMDEYRGVERYDVGQNIHIEVGNDFSYEIKTSIREWNDQYKNMTKSIFNGETFKGCEHFTQIIWAKTKYIGCAKQLWVDGDNVIKMTICNYGPRGNVKGEQIYTPGKACTKCPPDFIDCTSEEDHDGLCTRGSKGTIIKQKLELLILTSVCFVLNTLLKA